MVGRIPPWSGNNITEIIIQKGVTHIRDKAFAGCSNLTSVTIANSVVSIGYSAFSGCSSLTSITIPNSVTSIDYITFSGCSSLTSLTIPFVGEALNSPDHTFFGWIFADALRRESYVTANPTVPKSLKKVTITGGVRIDNNAFYKCDSIEEIVIEDGVRAISPDAFAYCTNLRSITIPESVKEIGYSAFYHCDLLTIKGYRNSAADKFARNNHIPIEYLDNGPCSHSYGAWKVTKEATCTADGTEARSCSKCGAQETRTIKALGHNFGAWGQTKAATCTEGSIETRTCSKCNAKETRNTKALGHIFSSSKVTKQPTCIEPGIESGICTRCGQTTTQSIPAAGHKFGEWNQSRAPTCTEKGIEERVCSVCTQKETRETEALGHDFDNPIIVKEATISTTGLMKGTCKRCGETTQEIIPCLAEDQSTGILVKATEGVFADGTTTQFSAIAESDASYESLKNALAHYASKFTAYQISFSNAPNGEYTLILPNDGKLIAENAVVCLISDNGTVTEKEFTVDDDGKIVVKTDSQGIYAIVDKTAAGEDHTEVADGADISGTVDKNNSTWIIVAIVVVVIAGAIAAAMIIRKRKNNISE